MGFDMGVADVRADGEVARPAEDGQVSMETAPASWVINIHLVGTGAQMVVKAFLLHLVPLFFGVWADTGNVAGVVPVQVKAVGAGRIARPEVDVKGAVVTPALGEQTKAKQEG